MTDLPPAGSQARLAADWAVILHSEAAALAVDREALEALQRAAARLALQAAILGSTAHDAPGRPRPDAPPGAASLADAPVTHPLHPGVGPRRRPAGLG